MVPRLTAFLLVAAALVSAAPGADFNAERVEARDACNHDNCLRAMIRSSDVAQPFCATYTAGVTTNSLPAFATMCSSLSSRLSSACTCLVASTATSTWLPTTVPVSSTISTKSTTSYGVTTTSSSSSSVEQISTSATTTSSTTLPPTSSPTPSFPAGPKICSSPELSCHNTTIVEDLCCFNAPGGQLLLTQFWDTSPSTGPNNSWTLHGLWPDHCDGTYDANCDASREYTNITAILASYSKTDLLSYMNTFWKDYQGNDETFWEHEWGKHGTCISTLEPSCYNSYTGQEEVVDYFQMAVNLFKGLDSYTTLANAGIVPSTTVTYTLAQIQDALSAAHGFPVTVQCSSGLLDQIWYHYNVLGSIQTGTFVPTSPDGSKSNCAATGVKYVPKYQTASPTSTGISTGTSMPTSTAVPFVGKGFLQAYTSGLNKGCLISAGTWYTTGTCATYTAASVSEEGFTLTSSKGPCGVVSGIFTCAAGIAATLFTAINTTSLAYAGSAAFYASAVPSGSVQQKVETTVDTISVGFVWQSL